MLMQPPRLVVTLSLALLLTLITVTAAVAHQPFFEEEDLESDNPMLIADPTVSTALYATLDRSDDLDYFAFTGQSGARILIGMTIPQIAGQEEFAPTVALFGPGLDRDEISSLPDAVQQVVSKEQGVQILRPPVKATSFYEPFSRTSYWRRQQEHVRLPEDGKYTLLVWHEAGETGRYVLVVGDREIPGGDILFPLKLPGYWTSVTGGASTAAVQSTPSTSPLQPCSRIQRLLYQIFRGELTCSVERSR
jgi:hypothetical protein